MTLPNGDHQIERISRLIVAGATLFMLLVGLWEIAAPFGAGHAAVLPARGIIADNMIRWGIWYPVRSYAAAKPTLQAAYAHHPFGTYYLFALVRLLFGRHEWAIRLVPVLFSTAMPGLLYLVGRRTFGALAGAMTALGWAVLPITLAFAQFPSFEMFALGAILIVTWTAQRFTEEMNGWRLAQLLIAVGIALHSDWIAYPFIVLVASAAAILVAFGRKPMLDSKSLRRLLQAVILTLGLVGVTLLLYAYVFQKAGLLQDWLGSAESRARGNEVPLAAVLAHRRYWIEVMFTKPAIVVGLLGAVGLLARLVLLRRFTDLYPLGLLLVATLHYTHFKNGADVHIYWPLPFAALFCFALGAVANAVQALLRWLDERRERSLGDRPAVLVALGVCTAVALSVLPDGLRALDYARDSGCRLNDDGLLNLQDLDKNLALTFFKSRIPERQPVVLQNSMFPNWSQDWSLERPTAAQSALGFSVFASPRHHLLDIRFAKPTAGIWAIQSRTTVVGPYWLVDTEARAEEFRAYGFEERPPSWLERFFVQAHDPIRRIVEDPYRTWEYRHHLAILPNPAPPGLEQKAQLRVRHNVLVSQRDLAGAALARAELEATLDQRSARSFTGGLELIGHRLIAGTVPRLEVYFLAAGSVGPDAFFDVRSRVLGAPTGSFVIADDKEKIYGVGFEIHPSLWQPGMIYMSSVEVRRRPGRESFFGIWTGSQRPRTVGVERIPLFER